jgi:FtsP/CotA-like multicopper oxidase with cupredoxin domain
MQIQMKRGPAADWVAQNPVLATGEIGVETDTHQFKIGDGVTAWNDLDHDGLAAGNFTECRPLLIGDPAAPFVGPETHRAQILDSKRLVLNGSADPATVGDLDASFGGIVLKGFRDHFWLYDYANNAWNTSDNINLSCETEIKIDNKTALSEQKVRVGNRVKSGKLYLGSGEHDSWRLGTNANGELVVEYRRLDGQWIEKGKFALTSTDKGEGLAEAANPYIERKGEPVKKPALVDPSVNLGKQAWALYESEDGLLNVKLDLNTDDAFALGRIMKRSANFNGTICGPVLKVRPGDALAVEFQNNMDDLGEIEPWSDGVMQRHEMVHMHLDDRAYPLNSNPMALDTATIWMQHIMQRGQTNLHWHGVHARPDGFGDNVMRTVKPGSKLRYYYEVPANHFGGLYWYHPHGHGGSMNMISRGAAGPILIEGPYQQRLNAAGVDREFMILQRMQWGDNLNGHDELNWVDYVSNLPLDVYDPNATPAEDGQKVTPVDALDLSPYYKDNLDPKCICSCAALEGNAPHVHGNFSMATPSCTPVDVKFIHSVNGQKQPVYSVKAGELKVFSMLNASGITFHRIAVKDHDLVIVGRDGVPVIPQGFSDTVIDPDFVYYPAGVRLSYIICNPGQRFEFFVVPKVGVEVSGEYPIYTLPITETETFDNIDAPVKIASIAYGETLANSASNHVSKLESLLPAPATDGAALPQVDFATKSYISSVAELQTLLGSTPIVATVEGASLAADGTLVMPNDEPHHLAVGARVAISGTDFVISELNTDAATFKIAVPEGSSATLPAEGTVSFEYDLFKLTTLNNSSTNNQDQQIVEILTDHYYYRNIALPVEALADKIVRRRVMSFAIHGRGVAGMGSGSTWMNESPYNDFNRTVAYLGTCEELLMENKSDVIHQFHIHVNPYQIMGYRDGLFGANAMPNPPMSGEGAYTFEREMQIAFQGYEDTTTIPAGVLVGDATEAVEGQRGQVRMRTKFEDYTGLFLMHCHLLDDQDMGMMQQVEVVAPGYVQAPYSTHTHTV